MKNNSEKTSLISKFSLGFVKNPRASLLLTLAIIFLGILSYSTFLKREGFPSIEVPFAIVQTPYFVEDKGQVDSDITQPIVDTISDLEEVKSINSTSTDVFSNVFVEFNEGITSEEGSNLIEEELNSANILPEGADPNFVTFDAGKFNGIYDFIVTLTADKPYSEIQEEAQVVADMLAGEDAIKEAKVEEVIVERTNPFTGETVDVQESFNRVGFEVDGELSFDHAINIGITKSDENIDTIEFSEIVNEKLSKIEKDELGDDYELVVAGDFAISLNSQIDSLESNAISALLVVLIVLLLFVNWRAAILTAAFIVVVMAGSFLGLYAIGYSLNVLSLFALILVLGLIVDDAIVVTEAIDYQKKQGEKGLTAIVKAINSVGIADISGTVTTVLVFLPMAFISGVLGEFIVLIPITVILTLTISIIVGLSLTPFGTFFFYPDFKNNKLLTMLGKIGKPFTFVLNLIPNTINLIGEYVSRFVNLYIKYPVVGLVIIILSFAAIAVGSNFAAQLDFTIFPNPKDTENIRLVIDFPEDSEIDNSEKLSQNVEKEVKDLYEKEIEKLFYLEADESQATIDIQLTKIGTRDKTSQNIVDELNDKFENRNEVNLKAQLVSVGPPVAEFQFTMQLYSEETETLENASEEISNFINDWTRERNENNIEILQTKVEGTEVIQKIDSRRFVSISAKLSDNSDTSDALALSEAIESEFDSEKLKELNLAEDSLGFDLGQESENLESFNSAITTTFIALIVMYVLLVIQFNSFIQPLLIFTAIPFSFPGLFPGLYVTDNPFSFFTVIGIIGLIGIVVNNSIMLLDFARQRRKAGLSVRESIVESIKIRFRPLVTTSVTTIVGLLPLSISDPFWESLGFSIIFGLASSTLLVIFVFPAYYALIEWLRQLRTDIVQCFIKPTRQGIELKLGVIELFYLLKANLKRIVYPIWR